MLQKKGKAKLREHANHEEDLHNGVAALRNVHWRLAKGQKLWEMV